MSKYQTVACVMDQSNHFCNFWSLLKMNCSAHMSLSVSTRPGQIRSPWSEHSCSLDFLCLHQDISLPQAMQMKKHSACCTSLRMNRCHFTAISLDCLKVIISNTSYKRALKFSHTWNKFPKYSGSFILKFIFLSFSQTACWRPFRCAFALVLIFFTILTL